MKRSGGYTLIEVLAVLMIIGVFALVLSPTIGRGERARFDSEVESLQAWLQGASSRALMDGGIYGVGVGRDGLSLHFYYHGRWYQVEDCANWHPSAGMVLHYGPQAGQPQLTDDQPLLVLPPLGLPRGADRFELQAGELQQTVSWFDVTRRFEIAQGPG